MPLIYVSWQSPLIVIPILHSAFDVRRLRTLVATARDKHDDLTRPGVVNAVTRSDIDPQLPNPVATKLVVAEIASDYPVDPALDGNPRPHVHEIVEPFLLNVTARRRKIVADFHREYIRL
jgi:hypothetical protein